MNIYVNKNHFQNTLVFLKRINIFSFMCTTYNNCIYGMNIYNYLISFICLKYRFMFMYIFMFIKNDKFTEDKQIIRCKAIDLFFDATNKSFNFVGI